MRFSFAKAGAYFAASLMAACAAANKRGNWADIILPMPKMQDGYFMNAGLFLLLPCPGYTNHSFHKVALFLCCKIITDRMEP